MNNASEVYLRLLETGRQIVDVVDGGFVVGHFCLFCVF